MQKKIIAVIMTLTIFFSMAGIAGASLFASEYINNWYAYTQVYENGRVRVNFDIRATGTMDVLGAKTIIIQEQAPNSSSWTAVATLKSDNYPNMLGYNKAGYTSEVSYYGGKAGYSYRAKVYFYAEKGGYDTKEFITY